MTAVFHERFDERLPTDDEVDNAAAAMVAIERARRDDGTVQVGEVRLSVALTDLVRDLFSIIARGETVTLVPLSRRLTTQEAADLLNVSRPFLIKLINQGTLSCEMVGTHRRLLLEDILSYRADRSKARLDVLNELQDISEELDHK